MKTCCTHWVVTIIAQKVIRVGEKRHFLSDSKKMKFDRKCVENVWYSGAIISSTQMVVTIFAQKVIRVGDKYRFFDC